MQSFAIEFGHSIEEHSLRRQGRKQPRAVASTTATTLPPLTGNTLVPIAEPTETSITLDLSHDEVSSTFSFPAGLGPSVPLTVGCKECKTTGSMKLTQGSFHIDIPSNWTGLTAFDIIQSGFVSLELDDFSAYILLTATPSASLDFAYTLFNVPVVGFVVRMGLLSISFGRDLDIDHKQIPGFGRAGITFSPQLSLAMQLSGGITVDYGFEVVVRKPCSEFQIWTLQVANRMSCYPRFPISPRFAWI